MTRNDAHPITVEVVRNAIVAYADEMANALSKAAYNMMIYEVRDYCCGLIDTQARMISQNRGGLPIFLADLPTLPSPNAGWLLSFQGRILAQLTRLKC